MKYIITALIAINVILGYMYISTHNKLIDALSEHSYTIDTIYHNTIIRDTIPTLRYVDVHHYITDTVYTTDSVLVEVEIPINRYIYSDTIYNHSDTVSYNAYVSGYRSSLDSIYFSVKYPSIKETIYIGNKSKWSNRFGVSIGAMAGYSIISNKPDILLGVGFTYKLY